MHKQEKTKPQIYERAGILSLEEVLPIIKKYMEFNGKHKIQIKDYFVNVQSLRLRTFAKTGVQCPCCDNKASFFAVERNLGATGGYHLNLYGINKDDKEILFTHDHIIARSLGGEDNIENARTMCGPCNWEKGRIEQQIKLCQSKQEKEALEKILEKYLPDTAQ